MKKLLGFLGALSLTATSTFGVVSCIQTLTTYDFEDIHSINKAWNNGQEVLVGNPILTTDSGDSRTIEEDAQKALEALKQEIIIQTAIKFKNNNAEQKLAEKLGEFEINFYRTSTDDSKIDTDNSNILVSQFGLFKSEEIGGKTVLVNNPGTFFIKYVIPPTGEGNPTTTEFLRFTLTNVNQIRVDDKAEKLTLPNENSEANPHLISLTSIFLSNFSGSKPADWKVEAGSESIQLTRFKNSLNEEISNQLQKNYMLQGFNLNGVSYRLNFSGFVNFLYNKDNAELTTKFNTDLQSLLIRIHDKKWNLAKIEIAGIWFQILNN